MRVGLGAPEGRNPIFAAMPNNAPIGIFDSGVGGLTVARALANLLPKESFIYFGDTVHLPYGDKSDEAIKRYSRSIAEFLIHEGAKAIVIACNSASAVANTFLIEEFGSRVPVLNVIDPVAEAVVLRGHETVGVIGTRATIKSGAYTRGLQAIKPDVTVKPLSTPLLVPVIEEGLAQSHISTDVLEFYLSKPDLEGIGALILGCTHYPILHDRIELFLKGQVSVVDSPQIVAETVSQELATRNLLADQKYGTYQFYVSDYTETFAAIARQFFGEDITLLEKRL